MKPRGERLVRLRCDRQGNSHHRRKGLRRTSEIREWTTKAVKTYHYGNVLEFAQGILCKVSPCRGICHTIHEDAVQSLVVVVGCFESDPGKDLVGKVIPLMEGEADSLIPREARFLLPIMDQEPVLV